MFQNAALRYHGIPWTYGVEDVDESEAISAIDRLRSGAVSGLNVTMPLKGLAAREADRPDDRVRRLGAANTLWCVHGLVHATNTDVDGVIRSIEALGGPFEHVVVLGAGGAAASALLASAAVAHLTVVARRAAVAAELVSRVIGNRPEWSVCGWGDSEARDAVQFADLVINATPLGMSDANTAREAFREAGVEKASGRLLDLVYSAGTTPFLSFGPERGIDGATMLAEQGAVAFEKWTGRAAPRRVMYDALFGSLGRPTPDWVAVD